MEKGFHCISLFLPYSVIIHDADCEVISRLQISFENKNNVVAASEIFILVIHLLLLGTGNHKALTI